MSRPTSRSLVLGTSLLAAVTVVALSGCITPPPVPANTPSPVPTADPGQTDPTDPTEPVETPDASPQPSSGGALPELVALNTPLPDGTLAGWETSILTADGFELQGDSDFPQGPTISVVETATGCSFWAYQGTADSDATDEVESSEFTLGLLSSTSPSSWEPGADTFELAPSASQGVAVEFLSIVQEPGDGSARAWFARNFQSSGSTSSIVAECPAGGGGVDHIDEVVYEYLQVNFLQP